MDTKEPFPRLFNTLARLGLIAGVIGVIGLLLSLGDQKAFFQAYLYGWVFWISMTIGCFGFMLMHNFVRGSWGFPIIRMLEAGAKLMPYMGVAFLPILFAVYNHQLYPWANPEMVAADPILKYRTFWFNPTFFMIRNVGYFVVFSFFAWLVPFLSREQERTGDPKYVQSRINISAPGFVMLVLLVTFSITDWVMSLDPHWYSTIYGFYFLICSGLSGLGFVTLLACILKMTHVAPYEERITTWTPPGSKLPVTRDLGNLMLTQTMVWGYFALSQFLITWSGNLPNEIVYYVRRNQGLLSFVTTFLVLGQFFVPFLLLLSGRTKRTPVLLALVCVIVLSVRIVEVAWNVIPMFHPIYAGLPAQLQGFVFYAAAFLGIGGLWLFAFVANLRRSGLMPISDYPTAEVAHHAA